MDRFQGYAEAEHAPVTTTPGEVFELAQVRRTELELDYAGSVTPPEAWRLVQQKAAILIDVRTAPEFKFVGRVPGTANVEWHGRDEKPRTRFLELLSAAAGRGDAVL